MADEWGNTQLYWAKDLGEIQEVNRDIVEWLDEEMQHPTDFKNIIQIHWLNGFSG